MNKVKVMELLVRAKQALLASGDVEYHVEDCPASDLEYDDGCIVHCGATCAGVAVQIIDQVMAEVVK